MASASNSVVIEGISVGSWSPMSPGGTQRMDSPTRQSGKSTMDKACTSPVGTHKSIGIQQK
eukprot:6462972-Amphidinium_carterae.2